MPEVTKPVVSEDSGNVTDADVTQRGLSPAAGMLLAVSAALEEFLGTSDAMANYVEHADESRIQKPLLAKHLEDHLSAADQKQIKRMVDEYQKVLPERMNQAFEHVKSGESNNVQLSLEDPLGERYPFSMEFMAGAFSFIVEQQKSVVLGEIFAPIESDALKMQYASELMRQAAWNNGAGLLVKSLIPAQLSSLRKYVSALLRCGVSLSRESLGDLPPIPREIYEKYGRYLDTKDIERWSIDQRVAAVIEQSVPEWMRTLVDWLSLDPAHGLRVHMENIVEADERCRLMDNSGIVDATYLANVPQRYTEHLYPGYFLIFERSYGDSLSRSLQVFALALYCRWYGKFAKGESDVGMVTSRVVELERNNLWNDALLLTNEQIANDMGKDESRGFVMLNRWFCMQQMGAEDHSLRNEIFHWQPVDSRLVVGRLALLRDYPALISELKLILNSTRSTIQIRRELSSAPLLQRAMSESDQVRTLLKDPGAPARHVNRRRRR